MARGCGGPATVVVERCCFSLSSRYHLLRAPPTTRSYEAAPTERAEHEHDGACSTPTNLQKYATTLNTQSRRLGVRASYAQTVAVLHAPSEVHLLHLLACASPAWTTGLARARRHYQHVCQAVCTCIRRSAAKQQPAPCCISHAPRNVRMASAGLPFLPPMPSNCPRTNTACTKSVNLLAHLVCLVLLVFFVLSHTRRTTPTSYKSPLYICVCLDMCRVSFPFHVLRVCRRSVVSLLTL